MIRKIALIGAASLFSVSVAMAQSNSSPDSTAGGAAGTSKQNVQQQKANPKGTTGAGQRGGESSPDSTAGGAAGTSKDNSKKN